MTDEYNVLKSLPNDGETCLAFGHKTFCCIEDMDEMPEWHEVIFKFIVSSYKIKEKLPEDIEESILEYCECSEHWLITDHEFSDYHLIGVTKWKKISDPEKQDNSND